MVWNDWMPQCKEIIDNMNDYFSSDSVRGAQWLVFVKRGKSFFYVFGSRMFFLKNVVTVCFIVNICVFC
jgi:hypothetical protein